MGDVTRLAEAMGWRPGEVHTVAVMGRPIAAQRWIDPDGNDRAPAAVPDPFTNANDDYAVLEWAREKQREYLQTDGTGFDFWYHFVGAFNPRAAPYHYSIGDYARAALAASDSDQGGEV